MNSGTSFSSTRQTVCTRNEIFRLSRLNTASLPVNSSLYVYGVTLMLVTSRSQVRPAEVGPLWTP